jgi:tetratricopeptide (TPR) repeat protein
VLATGDLGSLWFEYSWAILVRSEAERLILGREVSPPVTRESLAAAWQRWEPVRKWLQEGESLARKKRWREARDAYVGALKEPGFAWLSAESRSEAECLSLHLALALLKAGDLPAYERHCRFIVDHNAGTLSARRAEIYAKTCLLGWEKLPPEVRQRAVELARYAESKQPREANPPSWWVCHTAGMTEYSAGNYPRALELLEHAEKSNEEGGGKIACKGGAMVFRAMALKQQGREAEARELLPQAEALLAVPIKNRSGANWWDLDICEIALEEARALLRQPVKN